MIFRTDLALERREIVGENIDGVKVEERQEKEAKITVIDILTDDAAEKLSKGVGKYITVEMNAFSDEAAASDGRLKALTDSLNMLIPKGNSSCLVAGVGNINITADALGPNTASHIFATRHISDALKKQIGFSENLRSVSAVSSGVLGQTGIETGEYIKAIADSVKPSFVITIDALAAGSVGRLGTTVQMSNTGIAPGSGIGNKRVRIDESYLGVPVIAIGVPTVVDSVALAKELLGVSDEEISEKTLSKSNTLIVTPKDIDMLTKNASYLLGFAINCALQPTMSRQDLYALM